MQMQSKDNEHYPHRTDVLIQVKDEDLDDFYKWIDIIKSWYCIKEQQKEMKRLMEELYGAV